MNKILFIVAQDGFRDEELAEPKKVLEDAGCRVEVASIVKKPALGSLGAKIMPDLTVREANPADYEYVVIIGGSGAPQLADYPEVLDILRKAKNLAAICIAPIILAKAGLLKGKKATVFETEESLRILKEGGAIYLQEDVVVDGKLITANGPQAAEKFGRRLLESVSSRPRQL